MPWIGSTSTLGMLRAALAKPTSTSAPSMMSVLLQPSFSKCDASCLVLPSFTVALSSTMMPPSLALADSACLSASAAAAAELRHAGGAMAGAAGALLGVHFLSGAPDVGAVLHGMGAGAALG